jgi:phage tail-like protein
MAPLKRKTSPPEKVSFPGVFLEELPNGPHPIAGVPTSITAFVGRALRGPTDKDKIKSPVALNSYAEFERAFGGLWSGSTLGFAVRDFFLNGGRQAIIVRVYKSVLGEKSFAVIKLGAIKLKAASPGAWGGKLRVRIDHDTRTAPTFPGEDVAKLFNLTVKDTQTGQIEVFRNVSMAPDHPGQLPKVLDHESTLLKVDGQLAANAQRPRAHAAVTVPDPDPFSSSFANRYTAVTARDQPTDGAVLQRRDISAPGLEKSESGMFALLRADLFNLLCIPPHTPGSGATNVEPGLVDDAIQFCEKRRAFFLIDPPYNRGADVVTAKAAIKNFAGALRRTNHAALYFPTLLQPNPLGRGEVEEFAPCGAVAGVIARTDVQRGVWKAPAGVDATLAGVARLSAALKDADVGELNPLGINCLQTLPSVGSVVWGARTLEGDDRLASEWKYVPVRRTALFIEESLYRGTQWAVFEPNDEPLWNEIRLHVGAFMHDLFRQGAFQGTTAREAYFVKCDRETTTQADVNNGIVNIIVGFAPLKPAEFVVIKLQQIVGRLKPQIQEKFMSEFGAKTQRFDPYKNFKFRVKWEGKYVAGIRKVSGLKRSTEVVKHREETESSESRKSPGRNKFEAITLDRGVTHDKEFEQWAGKVTKFGSRAAGSKDFRKDIIIEIYNEAGQLARAYTIFRCWVSEFQAVSDLDANANAVLIQHIKLENEGYERE